MPSLLELTPEKAREYFLQSNSYVNFDLPHYFNFDNLLQAVAKEVEGSSISDYFHTPKAAKGQKVKSLNPKNSEGVNYKLISNKDGEFAWRPYEIIHPALYVALVNEITEAQSWQVLVARFQEFSKTRVVCESIPYVSEDEETNKAHQVKRWWTNVEQASIKLGMKYQYVFDVDVADCYGSIYTHSIAWALHDKATMKNNRDDQTFLGNKVDRFIQMMRYGQTNGIPQGSSLMDFVAEMVLGYADLLLMDQIKQDEDFAIIRFRDDYKIFTNNPELGRNIVKHLSQVLSSLGMKLNTQKTKQQTDPILASVKTDKIDELFIPRNSMTMSKWLLQIYAATVKHPNSGTVTRQLNRFYNEIEKVKKVSKYDDVEVMISIVVNIALKSPKSYQWAMAIISKLIDFCEASKKIELINQIRNKFERIPNTGLLDIWLQRISYKIDPTIQYKEQLALLIGSVSYPGNVIWQSSWLNQKMQDIVVDTPIIDSEVLNIMPEVIAVAEVALFQQNSPSL